ncbi:MAG TPA: c-type cytochrome [Gemmatimonas sp.]|nr:c-type cytochrome [Gemmatimonas sp.]
MNRSTLPFACFGAVLILATAGGRGSAATLPSGGLPHGLRDDARRTVVLASANAGLRDTTPLYTEEQATNGAALFARTCVDCHEPADYAGPAFKEKWNGVPMLDLYEYIRTKMPDDKPGTLTRDEVADATAYILKANGVRSGSVKIAPDSVAMSTLKLDLVQDSIGK